MQDLDRPWDRRRRRGLALLAAALPVPLPGSLSSGGPPDLLWCDLTQDQLVRFSDLDGDGLCASPFEAVPFHLDPGASPRDVQVRIEGGVAVAYWVDTVRDAVFRGVDANGDGTLEADEAHEFRSSHALDGGSSPDGLEVADDGAVWWSSDGGAHRGLFRLEDLDGDGDANDLGEQRVLVDGAGTHLAEVGGGTSAALDVGAIGRLAPAGDGVVAAVHGADEALYRFEDLDGDGDVTGPGESVLFLDASGKNPALSQNPDFASGVLPSLRTPATGPGGEPLYGRLAYLTAVGGAPTTSWVIACDSAAATPVAFNEAGQGLNGLVFLARDLNGDRDANDAGEVSVLYDGSTTAGAGSVPIQGVIGLDAVGEVVALADVAGHAKRLHLLEDADGNGTVDPATELTEAIFDLLDWTHADWVAGVPFPSGHAYVVELAAFPAGLLAPPTAEVSGSACSTFGAPPSVGAEGVAQLGASFSARIWDAPPGLPAWLVLGTGRDTWLGAPLPVDLAPFALSGCHLYVDPYETHGALTDTEGRAALPLDVPFDLPLVGFEVEMQWVVHDAHGAPGLTALATTPIVGP